MERGHRSVFRKCLCGCGRYVPPKINKKTGRVKHYPPYITGHGYKTWWKTMRTRFRGMGNPRAKSIGETRLHDAGRGLVYRLIKITPRGRWQYEHRVVATKKLGRRLRRGEHVHHMNSNTLDNRPENLAVLASADHTRVHLTLTQWSKSHLACVECGTAARHHVGHGLCTACYQRPQKLAVRRLGRMP
jgi:hypothetical protein